MRQFLFVMAMFLFVITTVGCGGIQDMYGSTGVGHHYKTNINPNPLLSINDVTFFQPIVSYYTYSISSKSNQRYTYFGHVRGGGTWGQSKYADEALSIDLYKRFPTDNRVFDKGKTSILTEICTEGLKTMDFNKKHFLVAQFPSINSLENLAASGLYPFSSPENEDSSMKKVMNLQENKTFYSSLKTNYIGFITITYVTSLLKDNVKDSVLAQNAGIQLKLYLIEKSQPEKIKTYKSVTILTQIAEYDIDSSNTGHGNSTIVDFFRKAYKELFKDKTFVK